ncbi:MAG: trypsin-like peptidase domain-containing protein, partial [Anaerolineae bacterium]|nr:trypsin-like peptidase domain-containing protein [Anaerolineae bacterium]
TATAIPQESPTPPVPTDEAPRPMALESLSASEMEAVLDIAEALTIQVYERVSPSVVNITSKALELGFYGVYPSEGSGSGFFIDTDGHIVTNYHVIEGAQSVEVTLLDGTVVPAEVVGADAFSDLAVLRVDVKPEESLPVDMSFEGDLRVGQRAIAIGNPFGLNWTLTTGVVSSLGRPLQISEDRIIYDVVQTDAAINPGNSGGPLLNSQGQLIGVNSAIRSGAENIGFAIPLTTVRRVVPELIAKGYYSHPWLGLTGYRLFPELARRLELPVERGLLVARIYDEGPAADAGLRGASREVILGRTRLLVGGDIVVALDDQPIDSNAALTQYLETRTRVGQKVKVSFYRGDRLLSALATVAEQPR